jgi:hypothetical protein
MPFWKNPEHKFGVAVGQLSNGGTPPWIVLGEEEEQSRRLLASD